MVGVVVGVTVGVGVSDGSTGPNSKVQVKLHGTQVEHLSKYRLLGIKLKSVGVVFTTTFVC